MSGSDDRIVSGASVPVLMYHSISDGPGRRASRPRRSGARWPCSRRSGYRVVSLLDLLGWMRDGRELPEPLRRADFRRRLRRLRHGRVPGTCKARLARDGVLAHRPRRRLRTSGRPVRCRGAGGYGLADDRASWRRQGVDFGGHGVEHRDLTRLKGPALEAEVLGSKQTIEDRIGRTVASFRRPVRPNRMPTVSEIVRRHYRMAVGTRLARASAIRTLTTSLESRCGTFASRAAGVPSSVGEAEGYFSARRLLRRIRGAGSRGRMPASHRARTAPARLPWASATCTD